MLRATTFWVASSSFSKKMSMSKKGGGGEALQLYVNVGRPLTQLRNVFLNLILKDSRS